MEHLTIASFKYGLDTRRSELTAQPGTLVSCENGHVNQGGQIEKRKAFTLVGQLPRGVALNQFAELDTVLDAFSLQATSTGLVTFGSANATVNTIATGHPFVFPTGITYQRLQHYVDFNSTADAVYPHLTKVYCSCAFNGKTFVSGHFAAGGFGSGIPASDLLFYNGSVLTQNCFGTVWRYFTDGGPLASDFAVHFAEYMPVDKFTSAYDGYYAATVVGPLQATFTLVVSDTDGGKLVASVQTVSGSAATAVPASLLLILRSTGTKGTLRVVDWNGVLLGTSSYVTSRQLTAGALTADINSRGTVATIDTTTGKTITATGWTAEVDPNTPYGITISAPAGLGATANGKILNVSTMNGGLKTANLTYDPSVSTTGLILAGGSDGTSSSSQTSLVDFGFVAWTPGKKWTVSIVYNDLTYTIGAGNISEVTVKNCLAQNSKLYITTGNQFNFSALNDPTKWETQDTGAGYIAIQDQFSAPSDVIALASYQGKLAVFCRWNTQIWTINADPSLYAVNQNLQNIGTMAPLSVQSVGDLDVLFLSDTGIRSLRVRDSSNNAYVVDLGSPIDDLITADLLIGGDNSLACAVIEPLTGRYWLHLKGTIYVLSYYPSIKVVAWTIYKPTYDDGTGNQVAFTPEKFVIYQGKVYCLAVDGKVFLYGGADNLTYDSSICSVELPWLDNKNAYVMKIAQKVNVAMSGSWQIDLSLDTRSEEFNTVVDFQTPLNLTDPCETCESTFDNGSFEATGMGTHFKFRAQTNPLWTKPATLSSLTLQYNEGEEI